MRYIFVLLLLACGHAFGALDMSLAQCLAKLGEPDFIQPLFVNAEVDVKLINPSEFAPEVNSFSKQTGWYPGHYFSRLYGFSLLYKRKLNNSVSWEFTLYFGGDPISTPCVSLEGKTQCGNIRFPSSGAKEWWAELAAYAEKYNFTCKSAKYTNLTSSLQPGDLAMIKESNGAGWTGGNPFTPKGSVAGGVTLTSKELNTLKVISSQDVLVSVAMPNMGNAKIAWTDLPTIENAYKAIANARATKDITEKHLEWKTKRAQTPASSELKF